MSWTRVLLQPIVFLCVCCNNLILLIKTVCCSIPHCICYYNHNGMNRFMILYNVLAVVLLRKWAMLGGQLTPEMTATITSSYT
jgi:hypothetical protein